MSETDPTFMQAKAEHVSRHKVLVALTGTAGNGLLVGALYNNTILLAVSIGLLVLFAGLLFTSLLHQSKEARRFRQMCEQSQIGSAVIGVDGKILWISPAYASILDYTPEELTGREIDRLTFVDDKTAGSSEVEAVLVGNADSYRFSKRLLKRNGEPVWTQITGTVIREPKTGKPTCFMSQAEDITERRAAAEALRALESRWNVALESAGQGVWDADLRTGYCYYSPTWKNMLGYDDHEIRNTWESWYELVHPDDRDRATKAGDDHIAGLTPIAEARFRLRHKDGRWIWMLDRGKVLDRDSAGKPIRMIGVQTDISDQMAMSQALGDEKELLRITLRSIAEAVICTDIYGHINFLNLAAETLTGMTTAAAAGRHINMVFQPLHEDTGEKLPILIADAIASRQTCERTKPAILRRPDGSQSAIHDLASPLVNAKGEVVGSVLVIQDVTGSQAVQRDLAYAASHDSLTRLFNRHHFDQKLAEAIAISSEQSPLCVLYIDLDRFKIVNDVSGHTAGDALLREVSDIILRELPDGSIVARLGGDEFGVLLRNSEVESEAIAEKIIEKVSSIRFFWTGTMHDIGASIGISMVQSAAVSSDSVMAQADVACYAAKAAGRKRVSIYRPEHGEAQRHMADLKVASGIKSAIEEDRLVLFAQEIRDLDAPLQSGGKYEILVRMRATDGSLIAPGGFIPTAERFELIGAIDRWVLSRTIRHYGPRIMTIPGLRIAVNLSASSLSDPAMIHFLTSEITETAFDPKRLSIEITETAMINNFVAAERFVADARQLGCAVSLDDFGSGVSSFSYLKRFKVDTIKIDGSFVKNIARSDHDRAIVRMIHELARGIGVSTIAEYVEDLETLEVLKEIGVDEGQGYLFHRPAPFDHILNERQGIVVYPASNDIDASTRSQDVAGQRLPLIQAL